MSKRINESGPAKPSFKIATAVRQQAEADARREADIMKIHGKQGMDAAADHANKTRR